MAHYKSSFVKGFLLLLIGQAGGSQVLWTRRYYATHQTVDHIVILCI